MSTPARRLLSHVVGWLADRRIPTALRAPIYRCYCRLTGADPTEAQLELRGYASLGAFFVRRLKDGARPLLAGEHELVSPCDGTVQRADRIEAGTLLQAKGRKYSVSELLDGLEQGHELEGGQALTIYLSPRDYHRVHAPGTARLRRVRWSDGGRHSVNPNVLARRDRVLSTNERAVLELTDDEGSWFLVMVGALNVGRIRVIGVAPGTSPPAEIPFERGAELARFEMGSTVVLIFPPGRLALRDGLVEGSSVKLGESLGVFAQQDAAGLPARG